jgi:hypothetical protein
MLFRYCSYLSLISTYCKWLHRFEYYCEYWKCGFNDAEWVFRWYNVILPMLFVYTLQWSLNDEEEIIKLIIHSFIHSFIYIVSVLGETVVFVMALDSFLFCRVIFTRKNIKIKLYVTNVDILYRITCPTIYLLNQIIMIINILYGIQNEKIKKNFCM